MNTVTLRTLVRQPIKVKRMTRAGQTVRVTDNGEPLWILHPADGTASQEQQRQREIENELAAIHQGRQSDLPLSQIIIDARR